MQRSPVVEQELDEAVAVGLAGQHVDHRGGIDHHRDDSGSPLRRDHPAVSSLASLTS